MEAEKYTFFLNIYLRQKKLSENCRKTVYCRKTVGKLSENRKTVGKLSENCRKTVGKLSGNCRETVGKLSDENCNTDS